MFEMLSTPIIVGLFAIWFCFLLLSYKGQPKGLWTLALANTGERFGYYTMLVGPARRSLTSCSSYICCPCLVACLPTSTAIARWSCWALW